MRERVIVAGHTTHWNTRDIGSKCPYNELLCTMPVLDDYGDEVDGEYVPAVKECGEQVYLQWTMTCDPSLAYADDKDAATGAWSSGWELHCAAGHVHVVSSQEDRCAPPYKPGAFIPPEPEEGR